MKTIPGIVGPSVLVVATALVTWFIVTHSKSSKVGLTLADWKELDTGFYSLVAKERPADLSALQKALTNIKNTDLRTQQVAYCFSYNYGEWSDSYPPRLAGKCPKEDSPTANNTDENYTNMSVLSHKIYTIRAADIEQVSATIK